MTRFTVFFLTLLVTLFTLEMLVPVQEHVIVPFTGGLARVSAALVLPFDESVIAYGKVLQFTDSGFAVSIEAGCNGVEAMIVLVALLLAFPAAWRHKLAGIALGFLTIQGLNVARIISLLYLGDWNLDVFRWIHLYLWPTLIMLDVLIFFVVYLRWLSARAAPASA